MITVLIADDHPITREGLALILGQQSDISVISQASSGEEALEQAQLCRPDVVIMDLQMPGMGGALATQALVATQDQKVVLLTTYDGTEDIRRGMRAGARAYLLKDSRKEAILDCVRSVASGGTLTRLTPHLEAVDQVGPLTDKQLQVLRLLSRGLSNKDIARELKILEGTVKSHVVAIMERLGATSRTEAAYKALRHGYLRHRLS